MVMAITHYNMWSRGHQPPSKPHLEAGIKILEEMRTGRIKLSIARQTTNLDRKSKPTYQFEYDLATQERGCHFKCVNSHNQVSFKSKK